MAIFYSQFLEVYDHTARTEVPTLYIAAARDFGRARQIFESVASIAPPPGGSGHSHFPGGSGGGNSTPEMLALVAVTKNNLVASSVLSKDSSRAIEWEYGQHNVFPIVKFS